MSNRIRVLSFDEAFSETGWVRLDIDMHKRRIILADRGTFEITRYVGLAANRDLVARYGKTAVNILFLKQVLQRLWDTQRPNFVVAEDFFMDPRRMKAGLSICRWLATADNFFLEKGVRLFLIPTKVAKQTVTEHGGANKKSVQECISSLRDLEFRKKIDINAMSLHETDAFAVAYAFVKNNLDAVIEQHRLISTNSIEPVTPVRLMTDKIASEGLDYETDAE
jgi:Holliday junction resolvasome RuvABC endonuclease subunit